MTIITFPKPDMITGEIAAKLAYARDAARRVSQGERFSLPSLIIALEVLKSHGKMPRDAKGQLTLETAIMLARAQFRQVPTGHPGLIRDGLMGFAGLAIFIVGCVLGVAMVLEAVK